MERTGNKAFDAVFNLDPRRADISEAKLELLEEEFSCIRDTLIDLQTDLDVIKDTLKSIKDDSVVFDSTEELLEE